MPPSSPLLSKPGMGCEDDAQLYSNYLVLDPKRAGFLDLARLLLSDDVSERTYIQCPETYKDELREFWRRWVIVISIVAQKLLHLFKGMLGWLGNALECCLNLPSTNGGFLKLITNSLTGNVEWPTRDSPTFASVVGNLDQRVDLDGQLKHGDAGYNAYLSMMAAKLSYENDSFVETTIRNRWKMEPLLGSDFWNDYQEQPSTRAIMFKDGDLIVVAFRGTPPFDADAWCTDIDLSLYELELEGEGGPERVSIHSGFMKALGLQKGRRWPEAPNEGKTYAYYKIKEILRKQLKEGGAKFIVTGHSLGGALAILFVGVLCMHKEDSILERLDGVYTFGQPRVGDERFGEYMKRKIHCEGNALPYYRYVYSSDLVPRLPRDGNVFGFKHFGPCLYFNSLYKGKVLDEEPNKNSSSLLWYIPNIMIAIWELVRGFIMPCVKGPSYRESLFLVLFRMIGLVIPGLSAHSPQDYVNLTRLGSLPSY
ncbi:Lipase_3 domain-containing protein [Psidium guajava]|nr:Lipase_3 domain-containing protein [Psidium guajava]